MGKIYKYRFELLAFALIVIVFHVCYGISIIMPSNINWLMAAYHDWGAHYLGWAYFQHEPWHFPIGHIENFSYPAGTNIGFTDSIPLFAIFFKIFAFLLPDTFQYFGIWLLLCHVMAGYFTVKMMKRYTANYLLLIFSMLLVSFCPVLIYRMIHPALCAHWLLIASIYYYTQKPNLNNVHLINKSQITVLILSALINPYLFLMVIGFNFILPFKHYYFNNLITLKRAVIYALSPIIFTLIIWYVIGMISFGAKDNTMEVENAYGLYGLNLNSFYNSSGFSSFFPQLKFYSVQQYEGYAYMGLGVFVLIFISLIYIASSIFKFKRNYIKNYLWLIPISLLLLLLSLFAISNKVSLNDELLFEFSLPNIIMKLGNVFRASGRFIWVGYYTIYLVALICFLKFKISEKIKVGIMILIVGLQFYDIKRLMTPRDFTSGNYEIKALDEKRWESISANFERIITYPLFENNLVYSLDYQDLCYIALKNELPITCGYVARNSGTENAEFKKKVQLEINNAKIGHSDLYIISPQHLKDFNALIFKNKVDFGYLNGYYYLYSAENNKMRQHNFKKLENQKRDSIRHDLTSRYKLKIIDKPILVKDKIQFNIDKNSYNNDILTIEGWAFLKNGNSTTVDSIYIVLENQDKAFLAKTIVVERPDVTQHFKNDSLKNSGFIASIFTDKLKNAEYDILIGIQSKGEFIFESINQPVFSLDKEIIPVKLNELPFETENVTYNIDELLDELGHISISGWAFVSNQNSLNSVIEIVLENEAGKNYLIGTMNRQRPDVTSYFKSGQNHDSSGFSTKVKKAKLDKGKYKIGILITTSSSTKEFKLTDKTIDIEK